MIRCAYFEYYATGEGVTHGVMVGLYPTDQSTKDRFVDFFGEYMERCAEYHSWDDTPDKVKKLLPENIKTICDRLNINPDGMFEFHCEYHRNLS